MNWILISAINKLKRKLFITEISKWEKLPYKRSASLRYYKKQSIVYRKQTSRTKDLFHVGWSPL